MQNELMQNEILENIEKAPGMSLTDALKYSPGGMIMEFGVASGGTINEIASNINRTVYGFDWFEGLPEDWTSFAGKGTFKCDIPEVKSNVQLIVGLFADTLPDFLETHREKVAFIHIDCDLYSSTKTVLDNLKDRIVNGTIIVFDEIRNYDGFENHEMKAFIEFLTETNYSYECIGNNGYNKAIMRIIIT